MQRHREQPSLSLNYSLSLSFHRSENCMKENYIAEITDQPIVLEQIIAKIKTENSGCVATYVGLIRDNSHGKDVVSVEYRDDSGKSGEKLTAIAREIAAKFPVNKVGLFHRTGILKIGDINFIVKVEIRSGGISGLAGQSAVRSKQESEVLN